LIAKLISELNEKFMTDLGFAAMAQQSAALVDSDSDDTSLTVDLSLSAAAMQPEWRRQRTLDMTFRTYSYRDFVSIWTM
jgi:hypothetical protein